MSVFTRCVLHPVEALCSTLGKAMAAFFSEVPLQWQPVVMLVGTATALLLLLTLTRYRLVIPLLLRIEPRTPVSSNQDKQIIRHRDTDANISYIESPRGSRQQKYLQTHLQRDLGVGQVGNLTLCDKNNLNNCRMIENQAFPCQKVPSVPNSYLLNHASCRNDPEGSVVPFTLVKEAQINESLSRKPMSMSVEDRQNQRSSRWMSLLRDQNRKKADIIGCERNSLERMMPVSEQQLKRGFKTVSVTKTQSRKPSQNLKASKVLFNDEKENSRNIPSGRSRSKKTGQQRRRRGKVEDVPWSAEVEVITDSD